jgi:hypothetical protein
MCHLRKNCLHACCTQVIDLGGRPHSSNDMRFTQVVCGHRLSKCKRQMGEYYACVLPFSVVAW